jgi:putative toxin-antitoxin system antitoxin component (TIGR02293 family)
MKVIAKHLKSDQQETLDILKALDDIIEPDTSNLVVTSSAQTRYETVDGTVVMVSEPMFVQYGKAGVGKTAALQSGSKLTLKYPTIATVESARNGTKFGSFKNIYDLLKLANSKWAEIIGVSDRTMQNLLKQEKDLDQNKSEKLLAFLTMVQYAIEVFGSKSNFKEWLFYKSPILNGKAPVEYVDTFQGISMLREHLFKIESGNFV